MNELMKKANQVNEIVNYAMLMDETSASDRIMVNEFMKLLTMFAEKIDTMYETQDIILGELRKDSKAP